MHRLNLQTALILGAAMGQVIVAQTQVDLRTQSKQVDFGAAVSTRPMKTGTALPGSCQTGEFFFKSNVPAGSNVYACTSQNTWVLEGGLPPQGPGTVLSSDGTSAQWIGLGGDVSGIPGFTSVTGLRSLPVSATAPQLGQALTWNGLSWLPQSLPATAGTITMQSSGTVVGTRGVVNLLPGPGIVTAILDNGSSLNLQQSIDTAVVLTRSREQTGSGLNCQSTSASSTAYTCALDPILGNYVAGMVLHWRPDVSAAGGSTTLEVNGLGTRAVKMADGITDPSPLDIVGGWLYPLWYDGALFRMISPASSVWVMGSTRPTCGEAYRGRIWHTLATEGSKDDVSVCAKGADDTYVWRVIY